MIITNSQVALQGSSESVKISSRTARIVRSLQPVDSSEQLSVQQQSDSFSFSKESVNMLNQSRVMQYVEDAQQRLNDLSSSASANSAQITGVGNAFVGFDFQDYKMTLIQILLEKLTGKSFDVFDFNKTQKANNGQQNKQNTFKSVAHQQPQRRADTLELRVSSFQYERSTVKFQAEGSVTTADGRAIDFNMAFEMNRSLAKYDEQSIKIQMQAVDPLVINFDGKGVAMTDAAYKFDLDADGKTDNIRFVQNGSGFLAIDDGSGQVKDGNQLFGTQSGDGFADLAKHDGDNNGWIDEADAIWDSLVVWVKDEDGKDVLYGLSELGIGAIYLGSVETDWTYRDSAGTDVAAMRRSGVYLNENGTSGTVQHVDLLI